MKCESPLCIVLPAFLLFCAVQYYGLSFQIWLIAPVSVHVFSAVRAHVLQMCMYMFFGTIVENT